MTNRMIAFVLMNYPFTSLFELICFYALGSCIVISLIWAGEWFVLFLKDYSSRSAYLTPEQLKEFVDKAFSEEEVKKFLDSKFTSKKR